MATSTIAYPIISQGVTQTNSKVIYRPVVRHDGVITNVRINDSVEAAYTVTLFRFIKSLNTIIRLYKVVLDGGDFINDDTIYSIKDGDYLLLESTSTTTIYAVSGTETISSYDTGI